jgi:hypothetical protein
MADKLTQCHKLKNVQFTECKSIHKYYGTDIKLHKSPVLLNNHQVRAANVNKDMGHMYIYPHDFI